MAEILYELVKKAKYDNTSLQTIINMFEPKLKKSIYMTNLNDREDLAQELKVKMVSYIKECDIDSIPGFWEIKEKSDAGKYKKGKNS